MAVLSGHFLHYLAHYLAARAIWSALRSAGVPVLLLLVAGVGASLLFALARRRRRGRFS